MPKTILITGSTDGIGLATAKRLAADGHKVLLHGRSKEKLDNAKRTIAQISGSDSVEDYLADLSSMREVRQLAKGIKEEHSQLDVLINNAGVYRSARTFTQDNLDMRFAVNTIAPYLLTQELLPNLPTGGRIVNVSSAAQAPVSLEAIAGRAKLSDGAAYAQSKLALNMWTRQLAASFTDGPMLVAVNPGSMLGSKMVKEAFGVAGHDIGIGADILFRAALSDEFKAASGKYFDNDSRSFAPPHPDGLNSEKCEAVVEAIEHLLTKLR